MRRAAIVLSLASSAVAAALTAFVFGSHRSSNIVEPNGGGERQVVQAQSIDTTVNESDAVVESEQSLVGDQSPTVTEPLPNTDFVPSTNLVDEEALLKIVGEMAERDVNTMYSLLLEHLGLTPSEKDALLSLLIEVEIANTWTGYERGKTIDKEEQSNRIAAIIGDAKLQEFLALGQNLESYAEVGYMESVLEKHDLPMTEAEGGRVLEILIDIQDRELALPGADAERGSIEYLEYRLAKMDERERLIFEQAASVLSAEQVRYLFEQYQRDSYRRADALERQKKARDDGNAEDLPLHYPGRSYPDTPQ